MAYTFGRQYPEESAGEPTSVGSFMVARVIRPIGRKLPLAQEIHSSRASECAEIIGMSNRQSRICCRIF